MLNNLVALMESRHATLSNSGHRKIERHHGMGLIVVVIDELPFFVANSDTKASKEFAGKLRDLIARGRAAGIVVILAAQKPSADTVPSAIRDLINLCLAFRCSTKEASDTILGGGWATQDFSAATSAISDRGVGLLLGDAGVPEKIRCYWLSDDAISTVVAEARSLRSRIAGVRFPKESRHAHAALSACCNATSNAIGLRLLFCSRRRVVLYQLTYHSTPALSSSILEKTCR